ncbi:hypothetical protein PSACC_00658 [Paramicrosporidium saccamoebae]|uniref:Uncharacterized protein n=1 Tax=Paramicrosporidium saccamoebae TaxID=1246581 RepID=A0A2H9TP66_9FUNG|nr:hypothetical protein PSACC_00658 [Paramicrosporidium saccamoebae]
MFSVIYQFTKLYAAQGTTVELEEDEVVMNRIEVEDLRRDRERLISEVPQLREQLDRLANESSHFKNDPDRFKGETDCLIEPGKQKRE